MAQEQRVAPGQPWARIRSSFRSDLRDELLEEIAAEHEARSKAEREALLRFVARDLPKNHREDDENTRIEQVRLLLAALPESTSVLRGFLQRPNASSLKEVHFTLFCFMPEVLDIDPVFARNVPRLVREYLFNVRDDNAYAAWMAADLMGDHWIDKDGLRVLVEVLHRARFTAGRAAALHGLRMLVPRLTRMERSRVHKALKRSKEKDRNRRVRWRASALLDELFPLRQGASN